MKKIFTLLPLLFCCAWLPAQITVTNATFPVLGDTLRLATDLSPGGINPFTPPGGNQAWDFANLQVDQTQNVVYKAATVGNAYQSLPEADLFVAFNGGTEAYFNVTATNFERMATLGPDPAGIGVTLLNVFNPPIIERKAPLAFFDIIASSSGQLLPVHPSIFPAAFLQSLPFTADSFRFRVALSALIVVDAWGTLAIPNGSFDVQRAKRTEYRESRLDAKVSPLGWLDVTDNAINTGMAPGLGVDTTVSYYFYNDVAKEPIAVVTINNAQNQAIRVVYKNIGQTSGVVSPNPSAPALTLFPNPTTESVSFEMKHMVPGVYALQIFGTNGTVVFSKPISGSESVDVSKLAAGSYFYQIAGQGGEVLGSGRFQKQ